MHNPFFIIEKFNSMSIAQLNFHSGILRSGKMCIIRRIKSSCLGCVREDWTACCVFRPWHWQRCACVCVVHSLTHMPFMPISSSHPASNGQWKDKEPLWEYSRFCRGHVRKDFNQICKKTDSSHNHKIITQFIYKHKNYIYLYII